MASEEVEKKTPPPAPELQAGQIPDDCRTVMLQNIPYSVSPAELLRLITAEGITNQTYLDVPKTKGKKEKENNCCMGYGFIGFETAEEVSDFVGAMQGYTFPDSDKVIKCTQAKRKDKAEKPYKPKRRQNKEQAAENKRKRKREENAAAGIASEESDGEEGGGGEEYPKEDWQAWQEPRQKRRRMEGPLTHEELADLDPSGSSVPSWLAHIEIAGYR